MKKKIYDLWLVGVAVLLLGLTACSNNAAGPASEETRPPAEQATAAPEPASGSPAEPTAEAVAGEAAEASEGFSTVETTEPTGEVATAAAPEGAGAQPAGEETLGDETLVPETETVSETAAAADLSGQRYGLVVSQLQDKGFNDLAWAGMQRAAEELSITVQFAQDTNPATGPARINRFINQGYDGIVAVGLEFGPAIKAAAQAHPDVSFAIVDFPNQTTNDRGLLFSVDAPAFLAGYLAAGMSQSGTVCTYGGRKIPPVLIFMVGFEHGVEYYNEQNDVDVTVLGWRTDPSLPGGGEGVFAGNFSDQAFGQSIAREFAARGCDIVFPVAGAVGLGTAKVAAENEITLIGVDADQSLSNPEYADLYLTSVVKHVDRAVLDTVKLMAEGNFEGGNNYIGRLDNGGVGLAPFHSFADQVPQALQADLLALSTGLLDGTIPTGWPIGASRIQTSLTSGPLSLVALRNATYNLASVETGAIVLNNGDYREADTGVEVRLGDQIAYGDLTGDGLDEAVVELLTIGEGGRTSYDLVVMADQEGAAIQIDSALLGEEVVLKTLGVEDGLVKVITAGAGSNGSTQTVVKFYGLQNGELVELSSLEVN